MKAKQLNFDLLLNSTAEISHQLQVLVILTVLPVGLKESRFGRYEEKLMSTILWDITPYIPLKVNRHFGGRYRLQNLLSAFRLVSCSTYSSNLKMEAICSSKTSADFQQNTRPYVPEDNILHNHRC
jgi:hypothetical protein